MSILIRIPDAALAGSLIEFLRRCECSAEPRNGSYVGVSVPAESLDRRLASLQLDGYLRAWAATHAGVRATVSDGVWRIEPPSPGAANPHS